MCEDPGNGTRICVERTLIAVGQPCDQESDNCQNSRCLLGVCTEVVGFGEACSDTLPCQQLQVYDNQILDLCIDGTCQRSVQLGQSCLFNTNCGVNSVCDRPLRSALGSCIALRKMGENCDSEICEAGLYCDQTCKTAAKVNENCEQIPCQDPQRLKCINNTCVEIGGGIGAPCSLETTSLICEDSFFCHLDTLTCGSSLNDGQSCRPNTIQTGIKKGGLVPTCQPGSACRCAPNPLCEQGRNSDPHTCQPYVDNGKPSCTEDLECALNEYCRFNAREGFASCWPGVCRHP